VRFVLAHLPKYSAADDFSPPPFPKMNGDPKSARQLFEQSFEQSKKLKSQEGLTQARRAIRRLDIKKHDTPQPQRDNGIETGSVSDE
jgi:hypothetical protein